MRNVDGEPLILETSYYPEYIYPNLTRELLETHSFYSLLYHVGVIPFSASDTYEAVVLAPHEAQLLHCAPGSAAFFHQRRTTTENGHTYEYTTSYMRADRVKLDVRFQNRLGTIDLSMPNGDVVSTANATFVDFMNYYDVTLMNPKVLSGMFLGSMMAFLFCGLTMNAVGRAAGHMVDEVRRQFREIKGILTGEAEPDYERCVAISTKGAQREMVIPSLIAILAPIATGLIFGVTGVLGLLIGGLSTGFVLAIFMANAGGAWDNAKKYVEEGNFGGKGGEVHKATVVGDTVGDPFKDTSGPSLNILIKLMSMVAIVMAGLTVAWSLF